MKCLFSISRRNSVPESGFSINKFLLDTHGSSTENDMIIALQIVKDNILIGACIMKVSVNKQLLSFVKSARQIYE